jgi:hypothetical protein
MPTEILTKDHVKIFKGKYFLPWFQKQEVVHFKVLHKVIVFDLDETLGSFADLYILWRGIKQASPSFTAFHELCDAFPEFLRYGIITILEYLYDKKIKKECHKIFIYTNNQCSGEWVNLISKYLESKVKSFRIHPENCVLFDKTICAFKINNKQVETQRTGHSKKMDDFMRCSLVSENADICFVDDIEYPLMKSTKVYYICPRPYIHTLSTNTIIKRITHLSCIPTGGILQNTSFWRDWFQLHNRQFARRSSRSDIELDLQVSQKMIYHLREFMMFGVKHEIGEKKRSRRKSRAIGGGSRTKKVHSRSTTF